MLSTVPDPKLRTGAISGVVGRGIESTQAAGAVQLLDTSPARGVVPESIGFSRLGPDAKVIDSVNVSKDGAQKLSKFAANDETAPRSMGSEVKDLTPRADAYGMGRREAAVPGGRPLGLPPLGQKMAAGLLSAAPGAAAERREPPKAPEFKAPDYAPQAPNVSKVPPGSAPNVDATRRIPGDPDSTLFRLKGVRSGLVGKANKTGSDRATLADASVGIAGAQAEVVRQRQDDQAAEMQVGIRRLQEVMQDARSDYRYRPEPVEVSFDSVTSRRDREMAVRAEETLQVPGAARDTPADFLAGTNVAPTFSILGPGVAAAEAFAASPNQELF
jgi:hypothetical protein